MARDGRHTDAMLVSSEASEGWLETQAILSSTDLMDEIRQGLREVKKQQSNLFTLEELLGE